MQLRCRAVACVRRRASVAVTFARLQCFRQWVLAAYPAPPFFRSLAPTAFVPTFAPCRRTVLPTPAAGGKLAHHASCGSLRPCSRRCFQRALGRRVPVLSTCRPTRRSSGRAGTGLQLGERQRGAPLTLIVRRQVGERPRNACSFVASLWCAAFGGRRWQRRLGGGYASGHSLAQRFRRFRFSAAARQRLSCPGPQCASARCCQCGRRRASWHTTRRAEVCANVHVGVSSALLVAGCRSRQPAA